MVCNLKSDASWVKLSFSQVEVLARSVAKVKVALSSHLKDGVHDARIVVSLQQNYSLEIAVVPAAAVSVRAKIGEETGKSLEYSDE